MYTCIPLVGLTITLVADSDVHVGDLKECVVAVASFEVGDLDPSSGSQVAEVEGYGKKATDCGECDRDLCKPCNGHATYFM